MSVETAWKCPACIFMLIHNVWSSLAAIAAESAAVLRRPDRWVIQREKEDAICCCDRWYERGHRVWAIQDPVRLSWQRSRKRNHRAARLVPRLPDASTCDDEHAHHISAGKEHCHTVWFTCTETNIKPGLLMKPVNVFTSECFLTSYMLLSLLNKNVLPIIIIFVFYLTYFTKCIQQNVHHSFSIATTPVAAVEQVVPHHTPVNSGNHAKRSRLRVTGS